MKTLFNRLPHRKSRIRQLGILQALSKLLLQRQHLQCKHKPGECPLKSLRNYQSKAEWCGWNILQVSGGLAALFVEIDVDLILARDPQAKDNSEGESRNSKNVTLDAAMMKDRMDSHQLHDSNSVRHQGLHRQFDDRSGSQHHGFPFRLRVHFGFVGLFCLFQRNSYADWRCSGCDMFIVLSASHFSLLAESKRRTSRGDA